MDTEKADETRTQLLALVDALDGPFDEFKKNVRLLLNGASASAAPPVDRVADTVNRWKVHLLAENCCRRERFLGQGLSILGQGNVLVSDLPLPPRRLSDEQKRSILENIRTWLVNEHRYPKETSISYHLEPGEKPQTLKSFIRILPFGGVHWNDMLMEAAND